MIERAGASAIQLEDQQSPKRCGHLSGKTLIETDHMCEKIAAAVDVALERILSRSVAANLGWRDFFSMPHMQAVAGDPRVEVAMQRWEQEEAELRESVRSYLADLQAAT